MLPRFPVPTTTFTRADTSVRLTLNGYVGSSIAPGFNSAPLESVTVGDAIGDLPRAGERAYRHPPANDFQRFVRARDGVVTHHTNRVFSPIMQARFESIPREQGADWRDLPNEEVQLRDGTRASLLVYSDATPHNMTHHRGHGGVGHEPQRNTLIPWAQAHTGNKRNHWAGSYGRLHSSGFFATSTTRTEPGATQGFVVHPSEARVVTPREWARSQCFPDDMALCGSMVQRTRLVGNAVPLSLGVAFGKEIVRAYSHELNCGMASTEAPSPSTASDPSLVG